jgi:hypothetical protein
VPDDGVDTACQHDADLVAPIVISYAVPPLRPWHITAVSPLVMVIGAEALEIIFV